MALKIKNNYYIFFLDSIRCFNIIIIAIKTFDHDFQYLIYLEMGINFIFIFEFLVKIISFGFIFGKKSFISNKFDTIDLISLISFYLKIFFQTEFLEVNKLKNIFIFQISSYIF